MGDSKPIARDNLIGTVDVIATDAGAACNIETTTSLILSLTISTVIVMYVTDFQAALLID